MNIIYLNYGLINEDNHYDNDHCRYVVKIKPESSLKS